MDNANSEAQASGGGPPEQAPKAATEIDPHKLANKIYRLMLADLRLERARGARVPQRKER